MMMRGLLRLSSHIRSQRSIRTTTTIGIHNEEDTIFALASGAGRAGVAVLRVSGPHANNALSEMTQSNKKKVLLPEPRVATIRNLKSACDGGILDRAMVLRFEKPRSFTGEDVVEFHLHGGPAVVVRLP